MMTRRSAPAEFISASLAVVALVLLVLNDRLFKQHPTWWTGKLSDVTGLFLVPYPLWGAYVGCLRIVPRWSRYMHPLLYSLGVGLVFAAAKTSPWAANVLEAYWPWPSDWNAVQIVSDPTDLLTLPFLPLGYVFARRFWTNASPSKRNIQTER